MKSIFNKKQKTIIPKKYKSILLKYGETQFHRFEDITEFKNHIYGCDRSRSWLEFKDKNGNMITSYGELIEFVEGFND